MQDASLGELLGAVKRNLRGRKRLGRGGRSARMRAMMARKRGKKPSAKKPMNKSVWNRLSPEKRKALVAAAVKKNSKLRRKLTIALLKRKLAAKAKAGKTNSTTATTATTTPAAATTSSSPAASSYSSRGGGSSQEQAQESQSEESQTEENQAEESQAEENQGEENQAEESSEENQGEEASEEKPAGDEASEISEPSAEEQATEDEASEADVSEASSEASGNLLLGYLLGQHKHRRRRQGHVQECIDKARPVAAGIEEASGGAIEAAHLLGAVGLIAKAKKGDTKAKKGIKAIFSKAKKSKKADRAAAKLTLAHQIMKKTGTVKSGKGGQKPGKMQTTSMSAQKNPYLYGGSWYQRGLAMIPGLASRSKTKQNKPAQGRQSSPTQGKQGKPTQGKRRG